MVDIKSKMYKDGMKAGSAFFSRQNEEMEYLFNRDTDNVSSIWGIYRFYGLVDFNFDTVNLVGSYQDNLDNGFLALTSDGPTPVFVPRFVKNAFDSMTIYYNVAKQHNKVSSRANALVDLNIKRGYINITNSHENHMQIYFDALTEYLNSRGLIDKIKDFNEFMTHFADFSYQVAEEIPITRTGFTRSVYANPVNGGLALEIESIDKANEGRKVNDFYQNPNFAMFSNVAKHFGFVIDRDVPWRLIADISSPRMHKFMNANDITKESLFDKWYTKTSLLDLDLLIKHAATFYNHYVIRTPQTTRPEVVFNNNCAKNSAYFGAASPGTLKIKKFKRSLVNTANATSNYGQKAWVKLYFRLRLIEEDIKISETEISSLLTSIFARSKKNNSIDMILASFYSDLEVKRRMDVKV